MGRSVFSLMSSGWNCHHAPLISSLISWDWQSPKLFGLKCTPFATVEKTNTVYYVVQRCRPINANSSVPAKPSYIRKSPILSGFQLLLFSNCFTLLQHVPSIWKVAFVASYHSSLWMHCIQLWFVNRLWTHQVEAELTPAQGFLLGPHLRSGATTKYLLMGKHWGSVYLCMV